MAEDKAYSVEVRLNALWGSMQQVSPRGQSITATGAGNIGGLSRAVEANVTHIVRGRLIIQWGNAANAAQPELQFAGPAVSQFDVSFKSQQSGTPNTTNNINKVSAAAGNGTGYNAGVIAVTSNMTDTTTLFDIDFWGMFAFTAAGTLTLQAATSILNDAWTVFSGFWQVW